MKKLILLLIVICNLLCNQLVFADMGRVSVVEPVDQATLEYNGNKD